MKVDTFMISLVSALYCQAEKKDWHQGRCMSEVCSRMPDQTYTHQLGKAPYC